MSLKQLLGKSVSWRVHATATTLIVTYLITGELATAGTLAMTLMVIKFFLYMYHEKLWEMLETRGYTL